MSNPEPPTYTLERVYIDELELPPGADIIPIENYIAAQIAALNEQEQVNHDES